MGGSFENGLQYCYLLMLLIRKDNTGTLIELAILLTHFMKEYFNSFDDIQFFHTFLSISRAVFRILCSTR